jgi:group II intron reverse transcriptase/maturase
LRKDAAVGVDGVTYQEYAKNLEANLEDLERRLRHKSYRARLVRRKYIPKGQGKLRPLGIPALEDKLVQYAVAQILNAIFETDFQPCSYGYRKARSAHDAVGDLNRQLSYGRYEFVFEADIRGFFEHLRHDWLVKMLEHRVADGALVNLVRKWLRAGILEEDGRVIHPESGSPQGGIISPVLSNVYLHYVLDLWFERSVKKRNQGNCQLFRYADDFVVCFERRHEAERFERDLTARLKHFGLELAADKTKTIRFGRGGGKYNGRFDFLGFEFRWEASRTGQPVVKRRTAPKKLRGAVDRFQEWIRSKRHSKIRDLMRTLRAKYQGHFNYYGVRGNSRSLNSYCWETTQLLFKWLNRRSQRRSYTWRSFNRMLKRFQIPTPRLTAGVQRDLRDLNCWMKENAADLAQVNLAGRHFVPSTHARAS